MSERGLFIVIEGVNGAGKSTLAEHLAARLPGFSRILKFPSDSTAAGRHAIEMVRHGTEGAEHELFQRLMVQDRIEQAGYIERLLRKGINVVADRYTMSGVAYGAADGLSFDDLLRMNSQCLKPDFCILIDTRNVNAADRQLGGGRAYVRSDTRQRQAARLFWELWMGDLKHLRMLGHESTGWVIVDGSASIMNVVAQAHNSLTTYISCTKKEEAVPETKQIDPNSVTWQNIATNLSRDLASARSALHELSSIALMWANGNTTENSLRGAIQKAELYLESKQKDTEGQKDELIGMLAQQNENLIAKLRDLGVEHAN